jgi:hypothetical protein
MQRVGINYAEETCLNNQSPDGSATLRPNATYLKNEDPVAGQPVNKNRATLSTDEKGLFGQAIGTGTDDSEQRAYDDKDEFPEGGLRGWTVVLGSFCGSFSVFGIINSTAILLQYFSAHQLKDYDASQIGWIFGLSLFLTFFCGAPIGPIFDAYGPRVLIFSGSVLLVASMFLLGLCTRKYFFQSFITRC